MTNRKGIILAGGSGTRLYPITMGVSKQLLPVYDKPMVYYPLSVLMLAGIREICVITTPEDQDQFRRTLGDGSQWGLTLTYIEQPSPDGLAQAYLLAEDFLAGAPSAMVLGDNVFFGHGLPELLAEADAKETGGTVFGYRVADPERYGVVDYDDDGRVTHIIEKPANPPSPTQSRASTSSTAQPLPEPQKSSPPPAANSRSPRFWNPTSPTAPSTSAAWAAAMPGSTPAHTEASSMPSNFVRTLVERQGLQIGNPDEIAYDAGWIDAEKVQRRADAFGKNDYGAYLKRLLG